MSKPETLAWGYPRLQVRCRCSGIHHDQNVLISPFIEQDLAVKTEGNFILRYRVFDIYASACSADNRTVKMQAECYGGPFRVYSTKEFPGLQASTELTKVLSHIPFRASKVAD